MPQSAASEYVWLPKLRGTDTGLTRSEFRAYFETHKSDRPARWPNRHRMKVVDRLGSYFGRPQFDPSVTNQAIVIQGRYRPNDDYNKAQDALNELHKVMAEFQSERAIN